MPKTPVDKNCYSVFDENHVGFPCDIIMFPVAKALAMEKMSDYEFRFGILVFDLRHVCASLKP